MRGRRPPPRRLRPRGRDRGRPHDRDRRAGRGGRHRHRPLPHPPRRRRPRRLHRDHDRDVRRAQGLGGRRRSRSTSTSSTTTTRRSRFAVTLRLPSRAQRRAARAPARDRRQVPGAPSCSPARPTVDDRRPRVEAGWLMDLGLDGTRLRRHRRQPRDRPRDGAAALRRGRRVLLVARNEEPLAEAAERGARRGGRGAAAAAEALALDVTDAGRRRADARRRRASASARLDVLVNNAGTARWRDLDDVPDEDWRAQYELNVMAPLRAMRAADPGDGRARLGPDRQRLLDRRQAALGGDARVLGGEGGRALALAPLRRPLRRAAACSSTRSAPARSNRSCGWSRAACSTSRSELSGHASREEALAAAGAKRPIGRLAEVGEIAARDRLPLLRARLLRRRRRLVGRRRHRPGDHLSRR